MLNLSSMSTEQLKAELRTIANRCRSDDEVKAEVAKVAPNLAVTVSYHGPRYMGMAMSHYHKGVISF